MVLSVLGWTHRAYAGSEVGERAMATAGWEQLVELVVQAVARSSIDCW